MKIAIYSIESGDIVRRIECPPDMIDSMVSDGESFYLNCPDNALKIINGEPSGDESSVESLETVRQRRRDYINARRDRAESSGFDYLGYRFDSDPKSLQRISVAVMAAQYEPADWTIEWTLQDNSTTTLNRDQLLSMPRAMAAAGDAIHQKARSLKEQIETASNAEEISGIVW